MSPSSPALRSGNRVEIAIGWSLAACRHPMISWRVLPAPRRYLVAMAYGLAAYVAVLAALLMML
jgi:hypothetical protein